MNKAKLVGMICKERLQTLEENPPNFWNKESPHTLFNLSSILRKKLDYNLHNKNPKICTMKTPMQELLQELKSIVTQSTCYDEIVSGVSLILLNDNHWIDKELDSLDEKHQEGWENALYEMERWTAKNKEKQ